MRLRRVITGSPPGVTIVELCAGRHVVRTTRSVGNHRRRLMGRGILLWLIGIPLPIIILIWILGGLHG
jgi:hypothetical protein